MVLNSRKISWQRKSRGLPAGAEEPHKVRNWSKWEERRVISSEYAEVHGNRYGTLKADILTLLEQGKNVVMDIDVQGAGQVRSCREGILPLCYADVYIYVPQAELKNRLCGRQTDGAETIALRLRNAEQEDACLPQYQYCLVSSDRETDYASFCALLKCQSMRVGLMR